MEPADYNVFADMLAKFHTSSEWIQALWLVAVPATLVGMTACVAAVLKEAIRVLAPRPRAAMLHREPPPLLLPHLVEAWPDPAWSNEDRRP